MAHILRNGARPLAHVAQNSSLMSTPARGFLWFGKENVRWPKDTDHATGEERLVRLAKENGIDDPFDLKPMKRGPGTKENPNLVHTFQEARMIGCVCEPDSTCVKYMWVHLDDPKRCECGHWFKAVPARKFWEEVADKY